MSYLPTWSDRSSVKAAAVFSVTGSERVSFRSMYLNRCVGTALAMLTVILPARAEVTVQEYKVPRGQMIRRPPRSTLFPSDAFDLGGRRIILQPDTGYDLAKDFVPISLVASIPLV